MRKILLSAFAILAVAPLAIPQTAFACSCVYYEDDQQRMKAYYDGADLIFQGTPVEVSEDTLENEFIYSVSVERLWKGTADAYVDIRTAANPGACGMEMKLGEHMIIFAYENYGVYTTGLCSGTMRPEDAKDITHWLNGEMEQHPEYLGPPVEVDCTPYICANGEVHPACTEDGYPLSYLVAPCQFAGGEKKEEEVKEEEVEEEKEDRFSDVDDSHPNAKAIYFIRNEGIVQGYEDGTYGPNRLITREEFTKIVVETLFGQDEIDTCESDDLFTDVHQNHWAADYICLAKAKSILEGYDTGAFGMGNTINFAETSKIVVNAFGIQTEGEDHLGVWWRPFVFALARIGGLPSSFTDPNQMLTRADMAEIIYRVMIGMEV